MNKVGREEFNRYFQQLEGYLERLPEKEEIILYYREYAEEGNFLTDTALRTHFGEPKALAAKLCAENAVKIMEEKQRGSSKRALGIGLLALFSLPITLPMIITVIALLFTMFILLFTLIITSGSIGLGFVGMGVIFLRYAWLHLMDLSFAYVTLTVGGSLMVFSLGGGCFILMIQLAKGVLKLLLNTISKITRRKKYV